MPIISVRKKENEKRGRRFANSLLGNWFGGQAVSLQVNYTHAEQFAATGYEPFVVDGTEYGEVRQYGNCKFFWQQSFGMIETLTPFQSASSVCTRPATKYPTTSPRLRSLCSTGLWSILTLPLDLRRSRRNMRPPATLTQLTLSLTSHFRRLPLCPRLLVLFSDSGSELKR